MLSTKDRCLTVNVSGVCFSFI